MSPLYSKNSPLVSNLPQTERLRRPFLTGLPLHLPSLLLLCFSLQFSLADFFCCFLKMINTFLYGRLFTGSSLCLKHLSFSWSRGSSSRLLYTSVLNCYSLRNSLPDRSTWNCTPSGHRGSQSVQRLTHDHRVMSLSPMLGIEFSWKQNCTPSHTISILLPYFIFLHSIYHLLISYIIKSSFAICCTHTHMPESELSEEKDLSVLFIAISPVLSRVHGA